jgi:hypothetical protein
MANRVGEQAENTVGYLVNPVPIRVNVEAATKFDNLVTRWVGS